MIPKKYAPQLFSLFLSGLMSLMVSGISTLHAAGMGPNFVRVWISAWLTAWLFAFPVLMLVSPLARKAVQLVVAKD